MTPRKHIPTAEQIADQCLVAFGAGAGTYNVTARTLRTMRSHYLGPITSLAGTWDKDGEAVLTNARELGRVCAELAGSEGSTFIDVSHFKQGAKELQRLWEQHALIGCPCMRRRKPEIPSQRPRDVR